MPSQPIRQFIIGPDYGFIALKSGRMCETLSTTPFHFCLVPLPRTRHTLMSQAATGSLPPDVIAELIAGVKESLATILIGFTLATTLYGITVIQTYLYYKSYPRDQIWLKLFVAALWILDTLTTILVAHSIYTYTVLDFGDPEAEAKAVWSFTLESAVVAIITLFVQCYFAYQLFKLYYILPVSSRKIIPAIIVLIAVIAFCIAIRVTQELFSNLSVETLRQRSVFEIVSVLLGLCALCDIIITVCLIHTLHHWKSGIASCTAGIVDKLILYALTRGIATSVCQIMFMSLNIALPNHTYWQPFHQVVGKLYVNSTLASLNFRETISEPGSKVITVNQFRAANNARLASSTDPRSTATVSLSSICDQSTAASAQEERHLQHFKDNDSEV